MIPIYEACTLPLDAIDAGTSRGIVTGGSSIHWPCLGALAIGAGRNGVSLAVADHGLLDWQREELSRIGVRWIAHPQPLVAARPSGMSPPSDPRAWWKPWVCAASPFDRSIWIDADAVLVGDLNGAFDLLATDSFVATQTLWQADGRAMYSTIVNYLFGSLPVHRDLPQVAHINTGIVGFRKGDAVIDDWRQMCGRIMADQRAMRMARIRDQTGFVAMLVDRMLKGASLPLLMGPEYNVPAGNLPAGESCNRPKVPLCPEQLWQHTFENHPGAVVVHWLGGYKPWGKCRGGEVREELRGYLPPRREQWRVVSQTENEIVLRRV